MRLYRPPQINSLIPNPNGHWLPFLIEADSWQTCDDIAAAEIIPIMRWFPFEDQMQALQDRRSEAWLLLMNAFHMGERQDTSSNIEHNLWHYPDISDRMLVMHQNMRTAAPRHVYHDIMWNRHKAFLLDYDDQYVDSNWSVPASRSMYGLYDLSKIGDARVFLSPTRVYAYQNEPRIIARQRLLEVLKSYPGWYSDFDAKRYLAAQEMTGDITQHLHNGNGGKWWPVAEEYYRRSFVSIYVETAVAFNDTNIITEKTYDPLVQGHFILPFGPQGLVSDILSRGFKIPNWLDYSYDDIEDFDQRLDAWLDSVRHACNIPLATWTKLHADDFHILQHNRDMLYSRPYHSLYQSVRDAIRYRTQGDI